ncbi:hypothetical protein SAY87_024011 [Trapa incisa]|uniref:Transmembrane protein n=1 Tax=Trapa incisa TaxID=236973 RepID=A0AAN7L6L9_9MYRT|nr:hypothetical protein SAY87_024011 [Trapa incisa]
MQGSVKLKASSSGVYGGFSGRIISARRSLVLRQIRLPRYRLPSVSMKSGYGSSAVEEESQPSLFSSYTSSVGSPSTALRLSQWNLTQRHILLLNVVACVAAVSSTWLFFSAIPTLLAFKRAAESMKKLMDTTREELPDTMAAIRLSGMEISDLTMELSDLGQEITQGVRSSTRAVRVAEERLRRITNMNPPGYLKGMMVNQEADHKGPVVAVTARNIRDYIVKGRSLFQMFLSLARFSRIAFNYLTAQRKKQQYKAEQ